MPHLVIIILDDIKYFSPEKSYNLPVVEEEIEIINEQYPTIHIMSAYRKQAGEKMRDKFFVLFQYLSA